MEHPYVLAKLHKSTSTGDLQVYAGKTLTDSRISTREVVTAVDSQGLNVYNIRSNQVVNSYSLSPSTKFHCAPVSCVDRILSTRRTYAALQTGVDEMKVQCWVERASESDTEVFTHPISSRAVRIIVLKDCILLLYVNGTVERLSSDLQTILEHVSGASYLQDSQDNNHILNDSSMLIPDSDEIELHLVISNMRGLKVYHIKISTGAQQMSDSITTFFSDEVNSDRKFGQLQKEQIAISSNGQLAIAFPTNKHTEILCFDKVYKESQVLKITHPAKTGTVQSTALKWLNSTHLFYNNGTFASIWDVLYKTCQTSITMPETCRLLEVVLQKSNNISSNKARAILVLASLTDLYLSQVSYMKEMSLLSAIGKQDRGQKEKDLWLQDIPIQSTWKDSISTVTADAKTCLTTLENARTGSEVDAVLEEFLFPGTLHKSKVAKRLEKAGTARAPNGVSNGTKDVCEDASKAAVLTNGHVLGASSTKKTNGTTSHTKEPESDEEELQLQNALDQETQAQVYPALDRFDSYDTDVSLSVPFITSLLRIILLKFARNSLEKSASFPAASLDFLLKKGLLSLSSLHKAGVPFEDVIRDYPDLRLRLVRDMSGLIPLHLTAILRKCLSDAALDKKLLSTILHKLDNYDESLVVEAVRNGLEQDQILALLELLGSELTQRLEDPEADAAFFISDEVLCASITALLDSFGLANIMFSKTSLSTIARLRTSIARLVSQHEVMSSTDCCVAELLMKARLLETTSKPRTTTHGGQQVASNPEPEPRRGEMPLDKVKRIEKGQSLRAKAHARVQGIGALYTIETLQI